MSNYVITTLVEMEEALNNDEYQEFREKIPELRNDYDEKRKSEQKLIERGKSIANDRPSSRFENAQTPDDVDDVTQFLLQSQTTDLARIGVLAGIAIGVPNGGLDGDLKKTVTNLKSEEEALVEAKESAQSEIESANLPALPRLYAVTSPSEIHVAPAQIQFTVIAGNAGDSEASDVELRVDSPNPVTITSGTETVELAGTSTTEILFEGQISEDGEYQIPIVLVYDGNEYTATESVEVLALSGSLDRAESHLSDLKDDIRSVDGSNKSKQRFLSSVNAALDSIQRAKEANKNDEKKKLRNHISTAINQLGALLNKIAADLTNSGNGNGKNNGNGNGNGSDNGNANEDDFSEKTLIGYQETAENVIDILSESKSSIE